MIYYLFLIGQAWAASGGHGSAEGHGDPHAIPWGSLFVQAFNFGFLFLLLFFALRKSIRAHFEHRARDYQQLVQRAEAARLEAERGRREIQTRLNQLESTADQSLIQARAEAEELKSRMIQEARTIGEKLEQDAHRTTQIELDKAKAELRRELLVRALDASSENLKKNLGTSEQKQLQREFVSKIQVVSG